MAYLNYYLLLINAWTFLIMLIDKKKAIHHRWRISEAALFGSALLGGSLGGTLGMFLFHHKTRKPLFSIGFPVVLILQCCFYMMIKARLSVF